jgi:N-acetylmuramoyl-L-alanine amidase
MQAWKSMLRNVGILVTSYLWVMPGFATTVLEQTTVSAQSPTNARFILAFNQPATYHWFYLKNPDRLVLDFQQTRNQSQINQLALTNTVVKKIRAGIQNQHDLRLVFDLTQPASMILTPMASNDKQVSKFLLDLNAAASMPTLTVAKPRVQPQSPVIVAAANPVATTKSKPIITIPAAPGKRPVVIVIDPGHGGKDPGASGPNGIHEKDIVLAISRKLYADLAQEPGVKVYMTRYGDYYIGLRQRLQLARRDKADIFIAVHADAYKDPYSNGASVFALSLRGASSEAARWLAEKENYSELGGVDLNGKNDMLRSVLIDLSQTATITSSLWLGNDVLGQINHISTLHKGKVEQAPFVVLKSPDIPSILVETGFISNPKEERALSSAAYQQKMALAITQGINQYFSLHPPI